MGGTTKTTAVTGELVELDRLLGRIGGDRDRVRRMVREAGGTIEKTWDGVEGVSASVAAKVVQRHDEQLAQHENFVRGYAEYCAAHEKERRAVLKTAFDEQYQRQIEEQREAFRAMKFVSGGEYLTLDPRRHAIASREAEKATALWGSAIRCFPMFRGRRRRKGYESYETREGIESNGSGILVAPIGV